MRDKGEVTGLTVLLSFHLSKPWQRLGSAITFPLGNPAPSNSAWAAKLRVWCVLHTALARKNHRASCT